MPKNGKVKILTEEKLKLFINRMAMLNLEELYKLFSKIEMGYNEDDIANPKDMEKYYSKEEQEKYGVVGIEMRRVREIK